MNRLKALLDTPLMLTALSLAGAVKLPAIFSDHAVLAKRNGVPVFGTAAPERRSR